MLALLLLFLLRLIALSASPAFPYNFKDCVDHRGRPGALQYYDHCAGEMSCLPVLKHRCVVPDLPPRLADGLWECSEGYQLTGARFSWPGGVFAAEPEACKPV